ncbi:alpha/beta fold hydrolase [Kordiimonas pumila]|uniref:Alpha/beta fold hydrolase n=1 Tax=Kordiimonas pumila TaxID=2161677 RepID=A0ABV7D794_9PROT|nr:alpha/beta hydrolase [Kordiimonas pumila]
MSNREPSAAIVAEAKAKRREPPEDAVFEYFKSYDGQQIRFARFPASTVINPKGTIIFLPGRTEFIEKFFEDIRIFNALGYACAAMDLRGQGMSYRPHSDRGKHFVRSFDPHISDVKALFDKALEGKMPKPFILMGHSAGSHVILRFLHDHPGYVEKAITVAPMVRIYLAGTPAFTVKALSWGMRHLGLGASYIAGHTSFKEGRWGWRKKLTHDDDRFADEDYFVKNKDMRLAVGGATYKWLWEALKSTDKLNAKGYAEAIETPVLILQASEDKIVDNTAQTAFAKRLPHGKLVVIEGAMHEILKEKDEYRAAVWAAIADFIVLNNASDTEAL